MRRTQLLRAIMVAAVICTACTGAAESPSPPATGVELSTTEAAIESDSSTTTTTPAAPSSTTAGAETTTTLAAAKVIQGAPLLAGFSVIAVLTPSAGGGTRPLLEWEPVAGASFYSVVLNDSEGKAYWATLTDTTSTYVGGPEQLLEDRPGPRVSQGGSWSVIALDADGLPLAASGVAPISP